MKRTAGISRSSLGVGMLTLAVAMTLFILPVSLSENQRVYLVDRSAPDEDYSIAAHEGALLSGVDVDWDEGPGGKLHVLADVTVDENFIEQADLHWKSQVRQMLENVNRILAPVRIEIDVASLQTWDSDNSGGHISQRLAAAETQTRRVSGNLLIAITADTSTRFDGLARRAGGELIVQHYPKHPEWGPLLIVHVMGHLLGANHHGEDDECEDEECIMASTGSIHTKEWCHHHLEVIEENIESRLGHSIP